LRRIIQQFVRRFVQVLHEVIDDDHEVAAWHGHDNVYAIDCIDGHQIKYAANFREQLQLSRAGRRQREVRSGRGERDRVQVQ
jgi:hypothetical protein